MQLENNTDVHLTLSPSWLRQYADHKQRIVIIGNEAHNVCVLAILVLKHLNIQVDYVLRCNNKEVLEPVYLNDNPMIIIDNGSIQKSLIDSKLDCLVYDPHIGVVCNDNINNRKVLEDFITAIPKGGTLLFSEKNKVLKEICAKVQKDIKCITFCDFEYNSVCDVDNYIKLPGGRVLMCTPFINLSNIEVVKSLLHYNFAIGEEEYYEVLLRL